MASEIYVQRIGSGQQNDTLRNVYNLFTTLFNPAPTLRPGFQADSAYRYVVINRN